MCPCETEGFWGLLSPSACTCNQRLFVREADVLLGLDGGDRGQEASAAHDTGHNRFRVLVPRHLDGALVTDHDLGLDWAVLDQVLELLDLGAVLDGNHFGLELTDLSGSKGLMPHICKIDVRAAAPYKHRLHLLS